LRNREIDDVKPKDMEGVTGVYATALLRAMRQNVGAEGWYKHPVTKGQIRIRPSDWKGVSRDFDLNEWSESFAEFSIKY